MHPSLASPRPLDHLVLPTADLAVAAARLRALGFTVAPEGVHPFGTRNACVYFADGAFLEPLAIGDAAATAAAAAAGNVFVARDRAFRSRNGEEGFSALVFGTKDARSDHAHFLRRGMSAGGMLSFSRPFIDTAGRQDTASFLLAFAAEQSAPDGFFFTCERVNTPRSDRTALQRHANGVSGITRVVLSATAPQRHSEFLTQLVAHEPVVSHPDHIAFQSVDTVVSVVTPARLRAEFDVSIDAGELRPSAIVFRISDLQVLMRLFERNGIGFRQRDRRIVVAPEAGQGAIFVFEASS